jgi:hypothetical protein
MQERAKNNTQRIKFKLQQISGFELQQYLNWLGFIFIFLEGDPATVIIRLCLSSFIMFFGEHEPEERCKSKSETLKLLLTTVDRENLE